MMASARSEKISFGAMYAYHHPNDGNPLSDCSNRIDVFAGKLRACPQLRVHPLYRQKYFQTKC